ncbi:MAG: homocysteine S-methyltransferase family protein [Bacteroidia bacterium]|nr:homocysteine S-methyltransferase family protein [Bacteroidia bacterium]
MHLTELLAHKRILILDGAMGTELQRQGVVLEPPLWSATALLRAPHVVRNIHFAYLHAGADMITTNTFRTNIRTLERAGMEHRWEELNMKAMQLALEARERYIPSRPVLIAGGLAPVEDCYRPDLVPDDAQLLEEHTKQAELLSMLRADFLLVETMMTEREAVIATHAAASTGKDVATSFTCGADGKLLSGEDVVAAARSVLDAGAVAVMINCVSTRTMLDPLTRLTSSLDAPVGCYANVGDPTADNASDLVCEVDVEGFALASLGWLAAGARLIGGCCGSTAEHITALTRLHSPETLTMQEKEIDAWNTRDRYTTPTISLGDDE